MVPRWISRRVGIDVDEFSRLTVEGIEGQGLTGVLAPMPIQIASDKLIVRCFFADKDNSPFLLGRADLFDLFNILFDARKKKVVLTRV